MIQSPITVKLKKSCTINTASGAISTAWIWQPQSPKTRIEFGLFPKKKQPEKIFGSLGSAVVGAICVGWYGFAAPTHTLPLFHGDSQ
jgi:hypothetical protein